MPTPEVTRARAGRGQRPPADAINRYAITERIRRGVTRSIDRLEERAWSLTDEQRTRLAALAAPMARPWHGEAAR
jgi:hypothetical protein